MNISASGTGMYKRAIDYSKLVMEKNSAPYLRLNQMTSVFHIGHFSGDVKDTSFPTNPKS